MNCLQQITVINKNSLFSTPSNHHLHERLDIFIIIILKFMSSPLKSTVITPLLGIEMIEEINGGGGRVCSVQCKVCGNSPAPPWSPATARSACLSVAVPSVPSIIRSSITVPSSLYRQHAMAVEACSICMKHIDRHKGRQAYGIHIQAYGRRHRESRWSQPKLCLIWELLLSRLGHSSRQVNTAGMLYRSFYGETVTVCPW